MITCKELILKEGDGEKRTFHDLQVGFSYSSSLFLLFTFLDFTMVTAQMDPRRQSCGRWHVGRWDLGGEGGHSR